MICPKCHGERKVITWEEKPVTMTTKEWVEKEEACNVCLGIGQVPDDLTAVIDRLDRIIKLLEKILKKGGKSNG